MRKEAYTIIKDYREYFVKIVLVKYGIPYSLRLTKRQKMEMFDRYGIEIILDEKDNCDKIYKKGKLIGYWNKNIELYFRKSRLLCKIEYRVG